MPMEKDTRPKKQSTLGITLFAAGIFLIGAAVTPWLTGLQEAALENGAPALPPVLTRQVAPQLDLLDLDGRAVSLADYRGRVVLVNNWATWCPPCRSEMPRLQAYYAAHVSQGFVIVAIESGDSLEQVSAFADQLGLTFPIWLDPQGTALEAFHNWNLPSSYLIDRDGLVRMQWTGELNQSTLEKFVTPLLEN